jgi:hypothetical protein
MWKGYSRGSGSRKNDDNGSERFAARVELAAIVSLLRHVAGLVAAVP